MDKEKKQELQQKYMEMQMIDQQINQIKKQIELIDNQLQELTITQEALNSISKTKPETEILVPLASGIFIKSQLVDNKEVIVNVGAGTTVKKTIPEAGELIKQQLTEITTFRKELEGTLAQLASKANQLQKALEEIAK